MQGLLTKSVLLEMMFRDAPERGKAASCNGAGKVEVSMHEHQKISAMTAGDEIRSVYLINQASLQQSRNGPYWRLEFKDASGTLEAKIWSPLSQSFPALAPGQMAEVGGRTMVYRDQLQLTVESMRVLDTEEAALLPMENYLPSSERPAADMLADIEALCDEVFTHKPWKKFVRSVFSDKRLRPLLLCAPAAKSMHHAYAGGRIGLPRGIFRSV